MVNEEKQYYWTDLESGVRFPCTKEFHDSMMAIWNATIPKFAPSKKMTSLNVRDFGGK